MNKITEASIHCKPSLHSFKTFQIKKVIKALAVRKNESIGALEQISLNLLRIAQEFKS